MILLKVAVLAAIALMYLALYGIYHINKKTGTTRQMKPSELIDDLAKNGWRLSIHIEEDGQASMCCATKGDCNCPHQKEADTDGHGFSAVDTGWEEAYDKTNQIQPRPWRLALEMLHQQCMAIVPGAPYPEKKND